MFSNLILHLLSVARKSILGLGLRGECLRKSKYILRNTAEISYPDVDFKMKRKQNLLILNYYIAVVKAENIGIEVRLGEDSKQL